MSLWQKNNHITTWFWCRSGSLSGSRNFWRNSFHCGTRAIVRILRPAPYLMTTMLRGWTALAEVCVLTSVLLVISYQTRWRNSEVTYSGDVDCRFDTIKIRDYRPICSGYIQGRRSLGSGRKDRCPIMFGVDGCPPKFCLLCTVVHMVMWYNAIIAFSSEYANASNHELRPLLSNWEAVTCRIFFGTRAWTPNFAVNRKKSTLLAGYILVNDMDQSVVSYRQTDRQRADSAIYPSCTPWERRSKAVSE